MIKVTPPQMRYSQPTKGVAEITIQTSPNKRRIKEMIKRRVPSVKVKVTGKAKAQRNNPTNNKVPSKHKVANIIHLKFFWIEISFYSFDGLGFSLTININHNTMQTNLFIIYSKSAWHTTLKGRNNRKDITS